MTKKEQVWAEAKKWDAVADEAAKAGDSKKEMEAAKRASEAAARWAKMR